MGEQKAERGLIVQGMVDAFCAVKHKIVSQVLQELLWIADGIFVDLDERFGECALISFHTTVDARATRVALAMADLLGAQVGIQIAFKFRAIIRLHLL